MVYNVQDRFDIQGPRMEGVNPDPLGQVTVRDTSGNSVLLTASLGKTESQEVIPGVAITNVRYQDFLITALDLDFGSGPVRPEIGWEVERQNGEIYRIVSLGDQDPPFEWITSTKKRMRIHAEHVRTSP